MTSNDLIFITIDWSANHWSALFVFNIKWRNPWSTRVLYPHLHNAEDLYRFGEDNNLCEIDRFISKSRRIHDNIVKSLKLILYDPNNKSLANSFTYSQRCVETVNNLALLIYEVDLIHVYFFLIPNLIWFTNLSTNIFHQNNV